MDEKKLVVFWYKRFNKLNKGILRTLTVAILLGFITSLGFLVYAYIDIVYYGDETIQDFITPAIIWILATIFLYWVFWTIVAIILWIYDGFEANK